VAQVRPIVDCCEQSSGLQCSTEGGEPFYQLSGC